MKIGIDMMGGDNPEHIVEAVKDFLNNENEEVYAFALKGDGNAQKLEGTKGAKVIYVDEKIEKDDDPAFVVRKKKESSLIVGTTYLKEGKIDAFISAESTGAIIAAGIFVLKRIKGISKPALPGFMPKPNSNTPVMLLDLGANIYPKEKDMIQYAQIARSYMKIFYNVEQPSMKLLNIGEEETKGTEFQKELYKYFKEENKNFQGNIEPRYVLDSDCDIILMDGWTGNILLKSLEGAAEFLGTNLKGVFLKNLKNKLSALTLKGDLKKMFKQLDYREFGGTPVLGVNGLLLKAHGSSNKKAFYQALCQSKKLHNSNFIEKLNEEVNINEA